MGYIYKISNQINNKVYIGQTSRTIEKRWKDHQKSAIIDQTPLYRAMRKYGIDQFHISEIEKCSDDLLNEREIYWIDYYNSYYNGYNATLGGNGHVKYSKEEIFSLWQEGKTEREISNILGCASKVIVGALDSYEVPASERVSRSAQVRAQKNGTPIEQYTLDGRYITTFSSSGEAETRTGISQDEINRCCIIAQRKRYDTIYYTSSAGGYIWKRENDNTPLSKWVELNKKKGGRRAVAQYTLDNNYIQSFLSLAEAARSIGKPGRGNNIGMVCNGKRQSAYGYIWKYEEDK